MRRPPSRSALRLRLSSLVLPLGLLGAFFFRAPVGAETPPPDVPGLREVKANADALAALDALLKKGEWETARSQASALLEQARGNWRGPVVGALARLAIAEVGAGQEAEGLWHWQATQAMSDAPDFSSLLAELGPVGKRLEAQPLRAHEEVPAGVEGVEAREGIAPARRTGGEMVPGDAGCTGARGPLWARLEAVIDAQGHLTLPTLVGPSACYNVEVLRAARGWTFEPARRAGLPVAGMYVAVINPPAQRPFREIAAGAPDVPAILALLEAGDFAHAEKRLDRLWNAALRAGTASRGYTVLLLALRSIALAAHADANDRSEAICLWQAAQGEIPALYHLDLKPFGKPGELLDHNRFGSVRSRFQRVRQGGSEPLETVQRPVIVRGTQRFPQPRRAIHSSGSGELLLESILDDTGAVRDPVLFERPANLFGFDLEELAAVCAWRYHPATLRGKPVPVTYVLSTNFTRIQGSHP